MGAKKLYICYLKSDPNKEPINRINAYSYEEALEFFSQRKKITKEAFLNIFEVELHEIESK